LANGSEPVSRRAGDDGDTDVRADYRDLPGRGSEAAGRDPRQPSGDRYESQSSEDEYLHGRILPPNTYPPGADYGGRRDYPGYDFGAANWQDRRDGDRLRRDGERADFRSGPQTRDGYPPRLSEDFEAGAGGWSMPRRRSGYPPEAAGGYGRDSDGDFRRAPDEGQWPANGARWHGDGGARWSDDGSPQWSGDGTAPGFGYDMGPAGSGSRSDREYFADPDGRYAPRPDARLPEPSRPELALPERSQPELPRPELALPELPPPDARLPELPRPEVALPDLPRPDAQLPEPSWPEVALPERLRPDLPPPDAQLPEPPQPEAALPERLQPDLPRPDVRLPEPSWPEVALPERLQPESPQPDYGPSQLAGFGGDSSRPFDSTMPGSESGRPAPSGPRTDEVPSSAVLSDRATTGLGRAAEGRDEVVPAQNAAAGNPASPVAGRDDDTVTAPLPAILPGAISVPRPDPVEAPRGFFEPARPGSSPGRPASVTGSVEPPPVDYAAPRPMSPEAEAKLDQLKDLYLTAEAIGADALDKHFDQVSQRQRELIKEFFQRSDSGGPGND
jgi:hypothetical protein